MTVFIEGFGEITADEYILNDLSILADEARENLKNKNENESATLARNIAKTIYKALCDQGFYDDITHH